MLRLDSVSKQVGAATHLYPMDIALVPGAINILLGPTLAGKTSLMRIMAGLDAPTGGRIIANDKDVTGVPVRRRNLAMVYQQFINYPSLTVFENIASPLRLKGRANADVSKRVGEIAESLRINGYLDRLPAELSGGQQQRTALARALAKDAELLLLDEPLANLDYKLREELREELGQLFQRGNTTVVYATTEPHEALQLGGHTTIVHEGKLVQSGRTLDVFERPASLIAARAFSDPPLNLLAPAHLAGPLNGNIDRIGVRPHHLNLQPTTDHDIEISARVELAEISGSDTYLHVSHGEETLVAQIRGVHEFAIGSRCNVYFNIERAFGFDTGGAVVFAPGSN